jgi:hypothetical protein
LKPVYKIHFNTESNKWVCEESFEAENITFYGYGQTPEDALAAIANAHKDYAESLWAT